MSAVETVECADDAALCRALEAGNGWIVATGRRPDGAMEDTIIVRHRASGFLAAVPSADVERFAVALPSEVAGALREAAARIRKEAGA